eukprot:CAMPEP_0179140658 /NCGR_PEP_ID=MMETSP0796-20121207/67379_1 /TAXON_ID=73915 /ORGANISM="Pyrodinium bahamense, Strain pbaha01" /LENGTH=356 /DNA_ID=CAMNT_0020840247 /DNA_START=1 /DNA_END=1069 /DNA_ORIENTATION=-
MRGGGEGRQGRAAQQSQRDGRRGDGDGGQTRAGAEATFNAAAWAPGKREYGLLHLLMCRAAIAEELARPKPANRLKSLETRFCSPVLQPAKKEAPPLSDEEEEDDDASYISEGEPPEPSELVSWGKGQRGAWWRVRTSLREDLVIRGGVSLLSAELRRTAPGEMLQQKGTPRVLTSGRAQGCIRMPIQPCGWVTADASRVGGPQYLIRAHAPRWRAVYQSPTSSDGDVIVRAGPELDSEAVMSLHCGDVVEQAGPSHVRPDGIVRMPITSTSTRRGDAREEEESPTVKVSGWVTADASAAGGPVFFKLIPDTAGESPSNAKDGVEEGARVLFEWPSVGWVLQRGTVGKRAELPPWQ